MFYSNMKNESQTSLLSKSDLEELRNMIPKQYYKDFKRIWDKSHIGVKTPYRQKIHAVLSGKVFDKKIIKVLVELAKERSQEQKRIVEEVKSVIPSDK